MSDEKKTEWNYSVYVIPALRKIWRWSPERKKAYLIAFKGEGWQCAECKKLWQKDEIAVDHIDPVVDPKKGWEGWDIYIKRLFVTCDKLQVLCKPCHKVKSNGENVERRKRRAA